jgi:hypothetical protein
MNTEYINNELLKYFLFNLSYDLKRDLNVSSDLIKEKLEPIKHYTEEDLSNVYDVYEFLDTLDSLDDFIKSNYDENSLNNSILKDYFTNIYKESYQTEETHKTNVNKQLLKNKALLILQSLYIKSENKSLQKKVSIKAFEDFIEDEDPGLMKDLKDANVVKISNNGNTNLTVTNFNKKYSLSSDITVLVSKSDLELLRRVLTIFPNIDIKFGCNYVVDVNIFKNDDIEIDYKIYYRVCFED